jgi:hypothetical protein
MALSLMAYEPIVQSRGLYSRDFVDDLTDKHERYNHTISAVGGFDTATFQLGGSRDYIEDWFNDGLMRRIVLYSPESIPVWEGFVSNMEMVTGSKKKTKSVDALINKVYMYYSPLNTAVSPPLELPPVTLVFDDIPSQLEFGVKSIILNGGGRTTESAFNWGRTVLRDSKDVKIGETVNTRSSDVYSLNVECLGYYHTLKWLPYVSIASSGTLPSHQVIQEVLTYFNKINSGWVSSDFGLMDYNFSTARRAYRDYDKSCWDVIEKEIIEMGGNGGERWVGGLYQNRQFVYKVAETIDGLYADEFQLYRSLKDAGQLIYDTATGTEVKPWDMLPDKVLHTVDVNVGGDRDLMYIEQIKYTEPYGLELVGGDDRRLAVFLARRGLPGL